MSTFPISKVSTDLRAVVLCGADLSANDRNVAQLLDFFGIPWEALRIDQLTSQEASSNINRWDECCILSSAPILAQVLKDLDGSEGSIPWLTNKIKSVFVYGFEESVSCKRLLKLLTHNINADFHHLGTSSREVSVTGDHPEICGPMSGLRVLVTPTQSDHAFDVRSGNAKFKPLISTNDGAVFARVERNGVAFYLSGCGDVINLDTPSGESFDVRKFFCSAVPITMYLKWAFTEASWREVETNACLIVDDPLLKARYGFLCFRRALELMDKHDFTMSLAFIPWNWRRTDPEIVKLFQDRSDRLSLSVHGCDHTSSEFAARSQAELNAKAKIACGRMNKLEQRTTLRHDRVMVFPRGEFSAEVGRVLKLNGFLAAVNTEVAPSRGRGNETRIADLWDVAINRYGSFPIFTRRYLTQGIENFAFDILLGKPCLIVAHHDVFKDDGSALVTLVDKLHSLRCKIRWGSLGNAIRRSVRIRTSSDDTIIMQIYGNQVYLENPSKEPRTLQVTKEEVDPDCVSGIVVNGDSVEWTWKDGFLRFMSPVPPEDTLEIDVRYTGKLDEGQYPSAIGYKVKTSLRRYLSETRDQYVTRSDFLNKSALRVRQLLK